MTVRAIKPWTRVPQALSKQPIGDPGNPQTVFDELADAAREQSDVIAERAVTIGGVPDGRAVTVAASDRLPAVSPGPFNDRDVVKIFCDILAAVVATLRGAISATADADPVSQDTLIGAAAVFEKHYWMVQAELA